MKYMDVNFHVRMSFYKKSEYIINLSHIKEKTKGTPIWIIFTSTSEDFLEFRKNDGKMF